jgi:putative endonuclease
MIGRERARVFGLRAEAFAALWLRAKGFKILARNFIASGGEIDLVARRLSLVVFVEVKARPDRDQARMAIDRQKIRRISRAARAWLAANPQAANCVLRGDAVLVASLQLPRHVAGAYELDIFA